MNINHINNLNFSNFIEIFKNIFEKTDSIANQAENLRPFKNKNDLIDNFFYIFNSLNLETKLQIIKNK